MKDIWFICDKGIYNVKKFSFTYIRLLMIVVGRTGTGKQVRLFSCSVICYGKHMAYWMKFYIWFPSSIYESKYSFFIGGALAERCCRSSLQVPEPPSGSQVRLFSCYVIYYGDHLVYWKIHMTSMWKWHKNEMYIIYLVYRYKKHFSYRRLLGCALLSLVVGVTWSSQWQPGRFIFIFCC